MIRAARPMPVTRNAGVEFMVVAISEVRTLEDTLKNKGFLNE